MVFDEIEEGITGKRVSAVFLIELMSFLCLKLDPSSPYFTFHSARTASSPS